MKSAAQKSLYLMLTAIMGALLFWILQRIAMSFYYSLIEWQPRVFELGLSFTEIVAIDTITALLASVCGVWYGIWIGMYWYRLVYEEGDGHGFLYRLLVRRNIAGSAAALKNQVQSAAQEIEEEPWQLAKLNAEPVSRMAARRRVIRKKTI